MEKYILKTMATIYFRSSRPIFNLRKKWTLWTEMRETSLNWIRRFRKAKLIGMVRAVYVSFQTSFQLSV